MELTIIASFLLGLIIGLVYPHKTAGVLKIDHSSPVKDVYRFEVENLDLLDRKTRIFLKVDHVGIDPR